MKVKRFKILSQFGLHTRAEYRNLVLFQKKLQKYGDYKIRKTYLYHFLNFFSLNLARKKKADGTPSYIKTFIPVCE
jgi:hypothetical protein